MTQRCFVFSKMTLFGYISLSYYRFIKYIKTKSLIDIHVCRLRTCILTHQVCPDTGAIFYLYTSTTDRTSVLFIHFTHKALGNQKKKVEEERSLQLVLKKEKQSLVETCDDLEKKRQKLIHDVATKDGRIACLEGQLDSTKLALKVETNKVKSVRIWKNIWSSQSLFPSDESCSDCYAQLFFTLPDSWASD